MAETATNGDGRKATVSQQLINNLKAELSKVKADLADELDRLNADAEKLRTSAAFSTTDTKIVTGCTNPGEAPLKPR